jgi:serine/threonine-protein kinase SRPK3
VFFRDGTATPTIQKLLDESPVMIHGEFEIHGVRYPLVRSQPIPHPFKWNDTGMTVEQYTFCLTGLGHGVCFLFSLNHWLMWCFVAQWADREPTTRIISPDALRAPEVILGADFDTKVDIWSLGCMVSSTDLL